MEPDGICLTNYNKALCSWTRNTENEAIWIDQRKQLGTLSSIEKKKRNQHPPPSTGIAPLLSHKEITHDQWPYFQIFSGMPTNKTFHFFFNPSSNMLTPYSSINGAITGPPAMMVSCVLVELWILLNHWWPHH